jgi:hypothetical protein
MAGTGRDERKRPYKGSEDEEKLKKINLPFQERVG